MLALVSIIEEIAVMTMPGANNPRFTDRRGPNGRANCWLPGSMWRARLRTASMAGEAEGRVQFQTVAPVQAKYAPWIAWIAWIAFAIICPA